MCETVFTSISTGDTSFPDLLHYFLQCPPEQSYARLVPHFAHPEAQGPDGPPRRCENFPFHKNPPFWQQTEDPIRMPDGIPEY